MHFSLLRPFTFEQKNRLKPKQTHCPPPPPPRYVRVHTHPHRVNTFKKAWQFLFSKWIMQLANCSWQRFWLTESFVLSDGKKLKGCIVMWNVPIKALKSHFFTFMAVDRLTVEVSSNIQLCKWHATVHIAHLTEACINCDVKVLFIFLMKCVYIFGELQVTQLWWSCACYIYFLCTCGLYLKTWAMGAVGTSTIFCFVFAIGFDLKWQVSTWRWILCHLSLLVFVGTAKSQCSTTRAPPKLALWWTCWQFLCTIFC